MLQHACGLVLFFFVAGLQALMYPGKRFLQQQNDVDLVVAQSSKLPAKYGPYYFDQRVDHAEAAGATFRQRVWVNSDWYKEGGPVILYNAGEMAADERAPYVTNSSMAMLARELQGVVIVMEHRSYGQSQPGASYATKYLKTLTTANALADMANIILHFKIPLLDRTLAPPEAKWIVYGGSYSGNLAAWMRQQYPDLVHAAVPSSAPVQMKYNFYEYFLPIQQYGPAKCIRAIEHVVAYVDHILFTPFAHSKDKLKARFGLQGVHDDDFAEMLSAPLGYWQAMTPTANPFNDFCAIFDNTKSVHDEIEAYAGYISELVKSFCKNKPAVKCIDSHDPRNNMYTDENDDNRPWMYQVCTEYAYWQTANVPWRPTIVSRMLTPNWYQRQCPYFFGEHTVPHRPAWRYTNQHYDGWHIKMNRTYFLDGEWDPWRTLSVQSKDAPAVPTDVDAKYVVLPRAVHHWDFFVTDTVDDSIKELHKDLVDTMRRWLKEEDTAPTKPTAPSNVIEQLHRPFIYQSPLSQQ